MNIGHVLRNQRPATGLSMVCGFAFFRRSEQLLVVKREADWWEGVRSNGLGGKINQGEGIRAAMQRTFREQCGVDVPGSDWYEFHSERFQNGNIVHYLTTSLILPTGIWPEAKFPRQKVEFIRWADLTPIQARVGGAPGMSYLPSMAHDYLTAPPQARWL